MSRDPSPLDDAEQLPVTYRRVLAWLDGGCSDEEIARRLAIAPQAVGPLVTLARAKLARLAAAAGADAGDGP